MVEFLHCSYSFGEKVVHRCMLKFDLPNSLQYSENISISFIMYTSFFKNISSMNLLGGKAAEECYSKMAHTKNVCNVVSLQ